MVKKNHEKNPQEAALDTKNEIDQNSIVNDTDLQKVPQNTASNFPTVGIGASAGGLAAFESFFSGMPVDR